MGEDYRTDAHDVGIGNSRTGENPALRQIFASSVEHLVTCRHETVVTVAQLDAASD